MFSPLKKNELDREAEDKYWWRGRHSSPELRGPMSTKQSGEQMVCHAPNLLPSAVCCPRDRGWARALMLSHRWLQGQVGCARFQCGAHGSSTRDRGLFNSIPHSSVDQLGGPGTSGNRGALSWGMQGWEQYELLMCLMKCQTQGTLVTCSPRAP